MSCAHYLQIIPAENPAHAGKGVNLLVLVDNPGPAACVTVRFFGSLGASWRELYREERELPEKSHVHAYFHLPARCFASEMWGGEELEELVIAAGETFPGPEEQGVILFFET